MKVSITSKFKGFDKTKKKKKYVPRLRSSNFISKSNPKCNPKFDEELKTLSFKQKYLNSKKKV